MKVNANQSRGFGLYQVILERMLHQLVNLQDYHSRITIVRIDLHFPDGQALNHKHEMAEALHLFLRNISEYKELVVYFGDRLMTSGLNNMQFILQALIDSSLFHKIASVKNSNGYQSSQQI